MHAHHEHLFVVAPVEDADAAALGQGLHAAPHEIVIEILRRRGLERGDLHALRVDARHHVLDGAVLAGGVHRLKDQQDAPAVLCVEHALRLAEPLDAAREQFFRLALLLGFELVRVARIVILEPEPLAARDTVGLEELAQALAMDLLHEDSGRKNARR